VIKTIANDIVKGAGAVGTAVGAYGSLKDGWKDAKEIYSAAKPFLKAIPREEYVLLLASCCSFSMLT
jgi:hypothetical protein